MTANAIKKAAEALRIAETNNTACDPIRDGFDTIDTAQKIQAAYAIKRHNHQHWQSTRQASGLKIGLTSSNLQQLLGLQDADYGQLYRDMELDNNATLSLSTFLAPKLEVEWALILGQDIHQPVASIEALKDKVSDIRLAFEIVDSRIANWNVQAMELVADNGVAAGYLLGQSLESIHNTDMLQHTVELKRNDQTIHTLCAADELGDPWQHALWLVNTAITEDLPLRQGQVLLTGTLTPIAELTAGDRWQAYTKGSRPIELHISE